MNNAFKVIGIIAAVIALLFGIWLGGTAIYNSVRVWNAQTAGEAELAQATSNRRIKILEAEASKEAAEALAEAEVIRARGVAEANRIVADGLGGPDGYLRYLYIQNIEKSDGQIIYIPTEGGLPILEASRLNTRPTPTTE